MKSLRAIGVLCLGQLGSMVLPLNSSAQQTAAVELGVFGVSSILQGNLNIKDNWAPLGVGGRLGLFVVNNVELELDVAYSDAELVNGLDVNYVPTHARLVHNMFVGGNSAILLGAGTGRTFFNYPAGWTGQWTAGLLVGLRQYIANGLSLRGDVAMDYRLTSIAGATDHINWAFQVGLSKTFGGRGDPDTDMDGVGDALDQCPATPPGELVDAAGCRMDSDGDGVYDAHDACASTPASARVDARGCALDGDGDGVIDLRDRCSESPAGEPVNADGCPLDADGDGVSDSRDACANTPAGVPVDATGCRSDTDGDGVADSRDNCSSTPPGVPVDAAGCPLDTDGDGVADHVDRCAATPARATVDNGGCPSDADGDGVFDGIDRCSATAAGTSVDPVGCPILFAADAVTVVLEGVTFATGSANLVPNATSLLDVVAESLLGNPTVRVEVGGHTDITGSYDGNVALSLERARSVRQYLISKGVAADRLEARGYGPDRPVADNGTSQGRQQNRRVELRRLLP